MRPPDSPACPMCGKTTLYLECAQPEYDYPDEHGNLTPKPTGWWRYKYDCVQCGGGRIEFAQEEE